MAHHRRYRRKRTPDASVRRFWRVRVGPGAFTLPNGHVVSAKDFWMTWEELGKIGGTVLMTHPVYTPIGEYTEIW
jgi:hypothetical protein